MDRQNVETVFFGPFVGELGWACSRWIGWCRLRRFIEFGTARSIAMDYDWRYPLYADFVDEFIPLPPWVAQLGWEQDCYELVPPDSQPGACTPVDVYNELLTYCKQFINPHTTWWVKPPRGCNFIVHFSYQQMWKPLEPSPQAKAYVDSLLHNVQRPVIVFSGRKRARSADRNIPESVWDGLITELEKYFTVVITGTPHSSALVDKVGRNIINVIPRTGVDGLDVLIAFLHRARMSVTSQSGPTLVSLQCETPSYIVGHEVARHSRHENFLDAPSLFRPVPGSYGAMDVQTMLVDIMNFNASLEHQEQVVDQIYTLSHAGEIQDTMNALMVDQEIEFHPIELPSLQQEVLNADTR